MPAPTGPNFEVDQGTVCTVDLTPDSPPADGSSAVLKLGWRPSNRDDHVTVLTEALSVSGGHIQGTLRTAKLTGLQYLLQIDLINEAGELQQRWRGILLLTPALP